MSQEQNPIPIFCIRYQTAFPGLTQVCESLSKDPSCQFDIAPTFKDATVLLKLESKALLLVVLEKKEDLPATLELLSVFQSRVKLGGIRVIVFDFLKNHKASGLLQGKGCRDLMDPGATEKAISHKIQQLLQIIEKSVVAKSPAELDKKSDVLFKQDAARDKAAGVQSAAKEIKFVEALDLQSDCWLLANKKDARNVMGSWLIEMVGPGPSAGAWTEVGGSKAEWAWSPKKMEGLDGQDPFIVEQGQWIYKGRQPEFVWKFNRWQFVAAEPSLGFYYEGEPYGMRFQVDQGNLLLTENSDAAKAKLPLMEATYDGQSRLEEKRVGAEPLQNAQAAPGPVTEVGSKQPEIGYEIKFVEALELQSDCWLLDSKKDARNITGNWLVEMIGPGPSAGEWVEIGGSATEWEWAPRITQIEDPFILEQGKWVYKGRQPEFIWKTNQWQFVGTAPSLGFYYEEESYGMRFCVNDRTLLCAENSAQAQKKLPLIQATFNGVSDEALGTELELAAKGRSRQRTGIGLGTKKKKEGYDFKGDQYEVGTAAFASMVLTVKIKAGPLGQAGAWTDAELLENTGHEVVVETKLEQLGAGAQVSFRFTLKNGKEVTASEVVGTVTLNEKLDDAGYLVSVAFEPKDQANLKKIASTYEDRQQEAFEFLKAAKGC